MARKVFKWVWFKVVVFKTRHVNFPPYEGSLEIEILKGHPLIIYKTHRNVTLDRNSLNWFLNHKGESFTHIFNFLGGERTWILCSVISVGKSSSVNLHRFVLYPLTMPPKRNDKNSNAYLDSDHEHEELSTRTQRRTNWTVRWRRAKIYSTAVWDSILVSR